MERIHYVGCKFFRSKILDILNIIKYITKRSAEQDEERNETQHEVETYRGSERETVVIVEIVTGFPYNFQKFVFFNKVQKLFPDTVQSRPPKKRVSLVESAGKGKKLK